MKLHLVLLGWTHRTNAVVMSDNADSCRKTSRYIIFQRGLVGCHDASPSTEAVPTPNCGDFADQSCWHPIRACSRTSVCYNAGFTEQARVTTSFHMQSDWFVDLLNQCFLTNHRDRDSQHVPTLDSDRFSDPLPTFRAVPRLLTGT